MRRADGARIRRAVAAFALAAATALVATTALAETIGSGFSDWLSGEPGAPASSEDRERFRTRNAESFAPLVAESDVRELIRIRHAGRSYRLLGLRTGGAACLRLEGTDIDEGGDVACAPSNELERSRALAVPLKVDAPLHEQGAGDRPSELATFGLVAAETRAVVLVGDDGMREATVANGAFLSITPGPVREHTTLRAFAVDEDGHRRSIPLAPALTSEIERVETGLPVHGPGTVERVVRGGTIGWLERREPRGEPLPEGLRRRMGHWPLHARMAFARLLVPDLNDFLRVVLGVRADRRNEICFAQVTRGGIGTSCTPSARAFAGRPFTGGWTYAGVGSQFVTYAGMASDDVARLELFLGTGERRPVALRDNVFVVRAARASFPARLVAYDAAGRVIGIDTTRSF